MYPPGPSSGTDGGKSVFGDIDILGGGYGGSGPGGSASDGSTTGGNAGGAANYNSTGTSNPYTVPGPYQAYGTWTVNLHDRPSKSPDNPNGGDGAGGAAPATYTNQGGPGVPVPQFAGPTIPQLGPVVPFMGPTSDYYGGAGGGAGFLPSEVVMVVEENHEIYQLSVEVRTPLVVAVVDQETQEVTVDKVAPEL